MIASREGWSIFAGVITALAAASVIGFVLSRQSRSHETGAAVENLNARIRAWWVMVFILAGALLAGPPAVVLLFAFISFAALREFMTAGRAGKADRVALSIGLSVFLPAQYVLVWAGWHGLFTIFIPVCAFVVLPVFQIIKAETRDFLPRTATIQWGLVLAVYCISHVPALLMLSTPRRDSALLLVFSVLVIESSDVLQYVCGTLFGRHRIAPAISPSKTVEGFAGGIVGATALGASLWRITPFSIWQAAAISLLIALTGFAGGLVMSAIKRDRGLKDWGRLVEGHGGMLDRLDSVCFAAPIFFHLARYVCGT